MHKKIISYLERNGWILRIDACRVHLYTKENEDILVPKTNNKSYKFVCAVAIEALAVIEGKTKAQIISVLKEIQGN